MLKQQYRLKKKYQFNYVYRVGKTCHGKFLLLVYSPSKNKNVKIGISASKNVGNSIQRNRAKRLLRESISNYLDQININFNLVIVAKESIVGKKLNDILPDMKNVLEKAGLIKWKF